MDLAIVVTIVFGGGSILTGIVAAKRYQQLRMAWAFDTLHLIETEEAFLPEDVEVTYDHAPVKSLTKEYIAIWNSGMKTIRKDDLIPTDPLRICVRHLTADGAILRPRIVKCSDKANDVKVIRQSKDTVLVSFEFLHRHDGAIIELLHTGGADAPLEVKGSVMDMPKGVEAKGSLPRPAGLQSKRRMQSRRFVSTMVIIMGVTAVAFGGLAPSDWFDPAHTLNRESTTRVLFLLQGTLLISIGVGILLVWRRRVVPRKLSLHRSHFVELESEKEEAHA